VVQNIDKPLTN